MDANQLLEALNEIDGSYVAEADIFQPVLPEKTPALPRILSWAGGLAACAAVLAGLVFLGRFGLLDELPAAASQAACSSAENTLMENAPENSFPEESAQAESYAGIAKDKALVNADSIPLVDLPQISFPTFEEQQADGTASTFNACGAAEHQRDLTIKELGAIWGQDYPVWEGIDVESAWGPLTASALYDQDQNVIQVTIHSSFTADGGGTVDFTLDIGRGRNTTMLGATHSSDTDKVSEVWGAQVTAGAMYGAVNGQATGNDCYYLSFVAEGGEPLAVRAVCQSERAPGSGEGAVTGEACKELLTRLASQCLRPEGVFRLSHLDRGSSGSQSADQGGGPLSAAGTTVYEGPSQQEVYETCQVPGTLSGE